MLLTIVLLIPAFNALSKGRGAKKKAQSFSKARASNALALEKDWAFHILILFQMFARSQPQEKVLLSFQPEPRGGVLLSQAALPIYPSILSLFSTIFIS